MAKSHKILLLFCLFTVVFPFVSGSNRADGASAPRPEKVYGVNRSGAEFGPQKLPGVEGKDYIYPTDTEILTSFSSKGLTVVRLPFLWERLQAKKFGELNQSGVTALAAFLDSAATANTKVILDLHNYGRYYHTPLQEEDNAALADVWVKLLTALKQKPALWGAELMNEPHDLPGGSTAWKNIMQTTVTEIRKVDTKTTLLIPGYSWQSAYFWQDNNRDLLIADPAGKLLYAAHIYFDKDFTGTYASKVTSAATLGTERILPFLQWLKTHKVRGILTEYGAPSADPQALAIMRNMLDTVDNNDELVGAIYWSSGPWWGDYPLSIEPEEGKQKPQMDIVLNFPSRANPAKLPTSIKVGSMVQFKNNPTIFLIEQTGLRPFADFVTYQAYKEENPKAKLYQRTEKSSLYTIRWQPVSQE